jgi:hypothetical protein
LTAPTRLDRLSTRLLLPKPVQSVRLFEEGLLFPTDPGTTKANVFPGVEPCDAPMQMLEDKATTSGTRQWMMISLRRTTAVTHLPNQGVGELGQDQALNHDHVAFEAANASKTL